MTDGPPANGKPLAPHVAPAADLIELDAQSIRELSAREAKFLRLYLGPCWGRHREAMLMAGYSEKATLRSRRLLRSPAVAQALQRNLHRAGVTPDRTIAEIAVYAFGLRAADFEGYLAGSETLADLEARGVPTQALAGVKSTTTHTYDKEGNLKREIVRREIKLRDPQKALSQLVKVLGLDLRRVEHTFGAAADEQRAPAESDLVHVIGKMLDHLRPTVTQAPLPELTQGDPEPPAQEPHEDGQAESRVDHEPPAG